jgi:hypothetical protein
MTNQGKNNPYYKHGMTETPPWNSWFDMIRRCERPTTTAYKYYGGRGIKVCKRWHEFNNFWADMKSTYEKGLTLDRINPNGDYKPSNCRWITKAAQQRNKRNTRWFTINGDTKTLPEWIERSGLKRSTVGQRYYAYGWSIEKALGMEA